MSISSQVCAQTFIWIGLDGQRIDTLFLITELKYPHFCFVLFLSYSKMGLIYNYRFQLRIFLCCWASSFRDFPVKKKKKNYYRLPAIACAFWYVVQSLSHAQQLFANLWTMTCQSPLSSTLSWSLSKFRFTASMTLSHCLILRHPFFFLPSILSDRAQNSMPKDSLKKRKIKRKM